ncbi:hypothetical protein C1Y63_12120 [Corynebacterium sp. 13CS0277]|uniref:ATP-binding cassette domain-containing protein n=1 Tax=Corynebacterium sp. 13CS0277 TaxID=2071994 RepID=UPI000D02BD4F|nr:ABC transporter ATP-binding protein [Corynebacterium sp. 13CS0277]PRQ10325.1 hypothetical protein C1Y63_12120 [Corynebacterium sp. 13CS0277]
MISHPQPQPAPDTPGSWLHRSREALRPVGVVLRLAWREEPRGTLGAVADILSGVFPALMAWLVAGLVAHIGAGTGAVPFAVGIAALLAGEELWGAAATTARLRVVDAVTRAADRDTILALRHARTIDDLVAHRRPELVAASTDVRGAVGRSLNTWIVATRNVVYVAGLLIATVSFSPWLLLAAAATIPHLYWGGRAQARVERARQDAAQATAHTTALIDALLPASARREIALAGTSDVYTALVADSTTAWSAPRAAAERRAALAGAAGRLITAAGLGVSVALTLLTAGPRAAETLAAMAVILGSIISLSGTAHTTAVMLTGTHARVRAWRTMCTPVAAPAAAESPAPDSGGDPAAGAGDIVVRDVSYRYPGATAPTVEGLHLRLPAGSTIALVGPNGAGKSTLAGLLLGIRRPTTGTITGIPTRRSIIAQDPLQLPGMVADSVRISRPDAPADACEEACARAHAPAPGTWVAGASGGQWQRLSIARALLRDDAQLAVFDEPTSALDAEAEAELSGTLLGGIPDATTLIVTHRLATARRADRILVVDGGRITADGTHDELVAQPGWYADMYRAQADGYDSDHDPGGTADPTPEPM